MGGSDQTATRFIHAIRHQFRPWTGGFPVILCFATEMDGTLCCAEKTAIFRFAIAGIAG